MWTTASWPADLPKPRLAPSGPALTPSAPTGSNPQPGRPGPALTSSAPAGSNPQPGRLSAWVAALGAKNTSATAARASPG
eukprot:14223806-Alexandrium_andersonii.AAC.1